MTEPSIGPFKKMSLYLRTRFPVEKGTYGVFVACLILFVAIIVAVIYGLFFTSADFSSSLSKPGGGLLDGLIANGISVIVSTILIAPLTAYFIFIRREHQLAPVRKSFVISIATGINQIARSYIHHYAMFGLVARSLVNGAEAHIVDSSLKYLTDYMQRITASLQGQPHASNAPPPLIQQAIKDAELLRNMVKDLTDLLNRETVTLENTLTFAMPLFPVEVVTDLHDIRQELIDFRAGLQDMLAVLAGVDDARIIARARFSILDFSKLIDKIHILAKASAVDNEPDLMTDARTFAELDKSLLQRRIADELVSVFEETRKWDANQRRDFRTPTP